MKCKCNLYLYDLNYCCINIIDVREAKMNHIKEVFKITNKNIQLATPLILYSLFSSIYLVVATQGRVFNLIFAFSLFLLMTAAFISGWFNMIKICIVNSNTSIDISFKSFPESVGKYFLSVLGTSAIIMLIYMFFLTLTMYIGLHYIGNPELDTIAFSNSLKTTAEMKSFLAGLSSAQLTKLYLWNILLFSAISVLNFVFILYFPALFFENKNPLKALWISLKNLFSKKFFNTVLVYILIFIAYFIISICSALASSNILIHLIITLLNFYFIVLVSVCIFYYYYQFFIQKDQPKIDIRI